MQLDYRDFRARVVTVPAFSPDPGVIGVKVSGQSHATLGRPSQQNICYRNVNEEEIKIRTEVDLNGLLVQGTVPGSLSPATGESSYTCSGASLLLRRPVPVGSGGEVRDLDIAFVRKAISSAPGPQTSRERIVNGGSFRTGWAPGGLGVIFGESLSDVDGIVLAPQVPFPSQLEGVSVTVNGVRAPIIGLARTAAGEQINLQVPFETEPGEAIVEIDNNGRRTTVAGITVQRTQPGIFEVVVEDRRIGAVLHQDFSLVTPSQPARPGEVVQIFFTGGGPVSPTVRTNQPGPAREPLARVTSENVVLLDGQQLENLGAFYAPGLFTAYQVNARIPNNAIAGDRALRLRLEGVDSQDVVLPVGP